MSGDVASGNSETWMDRFLNIGWYPDWNTHAPSSQVGGLECVIIEPRKHPWLQRVIANISCMFPKAKMTIMYDRAQGEFIESMFPTECPVRRVGMNIGENGFSMGKYCALLASPWIWELFGNSDRVLIFQADTGIRKNRLLRYWEYSYIGAPWFNAPDGLDTAIRVGNGGLSLRSPHWMKHVCTEHPYDHQPITFEDLYFVNYLAHTEVATWPTPEIAAGFSMEHIWHEDPMGFHQVYRYHTEPQIEHLLYSTDRFSHQIDRLLEVWMESQRGATKTLSLPWLEAGLGPSGLCIPKDSLWPIDALWEAGYAKTGFIRWRNRDGVERIERIPLFRSRNRHDIWIGGPRDLSEHMEE